MWQTDRHSFKTPSVKNVYGMIYASSSRVNTTKIVLPIWHRLSYHSPRAGYSFAPTLANCATDNDYMTFDRSLLFSIVYTQCTVCCAMCMWHTPQENSSLDYLLKPKNCADRNDNGCAWAWPFGSCRSRPDNAVVPFHLLCGTMCNKGRKCLWARKRSTTVPYKDEKFFSLQKLQQYHNLQFTSRYVRRGMFSRAIFLYVASAYAVSVWLLPRTS